MNLFNYGIKEDQLCLDCSTPLNRAPHSGGSMIFDCFLKKIQRCFYWESFDCVGHSYESSLGCIHVRHKDCFMNAMKNKNIICNVNGCKVNFGIHRYSFLRRM